MIKIPFVFGLTLDLEHYKEDVIVYTGFLIPQVVVAIIDSHSTIWNRGMLLDK